MRQLPKAIPELDGGLFLPRQVVGLLEAVLNEHERLLRQSGHEEGLLVLDQTRELLRMGGARPPVATAREQLDMVDPQQERLSRNLLCCSKI